MPKKISKSKRAAPKPIVIHLVHPTIKPAVHPSLSNQYMNVPFEGPQMGNALADRGRINTVA